MSDAPSPRLLSFVLPVYSEAESLEPLHQAITEVMRTRPEDYEVLFVDDGSDDESFATMLRLRESDPRVRAIRFRRNFGKAAAYSAGFEHARGEIILTMDTDLQDDPGDIPVLLEKIDEGYDLVSGWKHEGKGKLERAVPSRFFNRVVRRVTGIPLHDFNCPFKAYRREVLDEIEVYGELHRYIPVLAHAKGFRIGEVKIKNLPRQHGQTKYGFERYLRGMLDLITVTFITRFAQRPMHLLALAGIGSTLLGLGTLAFFLLAHVAHVAGLLADVSWNIHERPFISLGILLVIVGVQFLSMGLLAELIVTKSSLRRRDLGYSVQETLGMEDSPAGETETGQ